MGLAGFFGFICVCGERADGKWLGRCERGMWKRDGVLSTA